MSPLQGAYIKEVRLRPTLPIRLPWLAAVSWLVSAPSPIPVPSAWCRLEPAFRGHCLMQPPLYYGQFSWWQLHHFCTSLEAATCL